MSDLIKFATNGHNHTGVEAARVMKPWATAAGYRSEDLKQTPGIMQQAVEDIEKSWGLTAANALLFSGDYLKSSFYEALSASGHPSPVGHPGDWNTGNGDLWVKQEVLRLQWLKRRLDVICGKKKPGINANE